MSLMNAQAANIHR